MKNKKQNSWEISLTGNELWLGGGSGESPAQIENHTLDEIVGFKIGRSDIKFFTEADIQIMLMQLSDKYDFINIERLQDITPYDVLNEISNKIKYGE